MPNIIESLKKGKEFLSDNDNARRITTLAAMFQV
jgi:hypothetical protein